MMLQQVSGWFSDRIDPERPAEAAPPRSLIAFIRWALAGAWGTIAMATVASDGAVPWHGDRCGPCQRTGGLLF